MNPLERRVTAGPVELRIEGEQRSLIGYAAVFNQEAVIGEFFRELIEPGAFDEALTTDDVRALFNHDPSLILGRNTAKTLRLSSDATGLRYEIDPPATSYAADLVVSVQRGDVSQSSFAFRVLEETWVNKTEATGLPLRRIRRVSLYDVSPVTYPAYEGTSVSARAEEVARAVMPVPFVTDPALRHRWAILEAEC